MSQINGSKVNGNGSSATYARDPEVVGRAKRRQFSVNDKLRILREADECSEPGQIGALLRREGIYSSYLTQWRRERENGQLLSVTAHKHGRPHDEQGAALSSLAQENAALKARLVQAELIIVAKKTCTDLSANVDTAQGTALMIAAIEGLSQSLSVSQACAVFGFPRSSLYRRRQAKAPAAKPARPTPARALSAAERATVQALLTSAQFVDQSPYEVYATLLDEGVYHCSIRTMYRLLHQQQQVQERRNQRRHPTYTKPRPVGTRLATGPNQLWSWDITKLRGPATWQYDYLYVILDVFSRYVVGWLLADHESATLAEQLIAESCAKQAIARDQLTLHADRAPREPAAMTAKSLAHLLSDLGVNQSHARPYTPDDNPFSEAQFKTMKYRPDYPARFDSQAHAHTWARAFFPWYNQSHHHVGLALLTPAAVHFGQAPTLIAQRQVTLAAAYARNPDRFVHGAPVPPVLPTAVWINPPTASADQEADHV